MSVHEHRAAADRGPLCVDILVVSSTRTLETDTAGSLIALLLEGAGHRVGRRAIVADDMGAISTETRRSVADDGVDVLILTGGTGISARDVTPESVGPLLDRTLPGFGEIFRMLSYKEIGAAAMMSRAFAGIAGRTLVFGLPGSKAACRLAVEALILEELGHLAHQVTKEERTSPPVPTKTTSGPPPLRATVGVAETPVVPEPSTTPTEELAPTGWTAFVRSMGGEIHDRRPSIPGVVTAVAPVLTVLQQAGKAAVMETRDGVRYGLFGFPDLTSKRSKVLAVREGGEHGEILALHRYPTLTGTCVAGGAVPYRDRVVDACEVTVGKPPADESGKVFAVQGDSVYIERGGKVVRWDGRRERDEGRTKQVIATLVLHWSRR